MAGSEIGTSEAPGPAIDLAHLQAWVGRIETAEDLIAPAQAGALAATLDQDWRPEAGQALPPLWHWAFFRPVAARSALGADGHPRLGGFLPPIPLPRRMWVGGRLSFHAPLRIGARARRETRIAKVAAKSGRNGDLVFVTLSHEIASEGELALREEQDLVYRPASTGEGPAPAPDLPRRPADWRDGMVPDPVLLFRYSAVTFNSHRIHYDTPYARRDEGYPALVVQGPLTATLLAGGLAAHTRGRLAAFGFRAHQPLFCGRPMALCGRAAERPGGFDLWAETEGGGVAMTATARLDAAD